MSDEEKRAIERIDYIQDFIIENGQYNADVNDMGYFSRILNLIEKQQKEIEGLVKVSKECIEEKFNNDNMWKDKIRLKMKQEMDKGYRLSEERHLQNYAYDRLKELLGEE